MTEIKGTVSSLENDIKRILFRVTLFFRLANEHIPIYINRNALVSQLGIPAIEVPIYKQNSRLNQKGQRFGNSLSVGWKYLGRQSNRCYYFPLHVSPCATQLDIVSLWWHFA